MGIDSSALLAILMDEPERRLFDETIEADSRKLLSAGSLLETSIVLTSRQGRNAVEALDRFLDYSVIEVVSVTQEHAELAREAFRRYGKGRHPARLNFGDCFTYALCKASGEPLLQKGEDFKKTDLKLVIS